MIKSPFCGAYKIIILGHNHLCLTYTTIIIQDKRMKCYTHPLAKISFFKKPIPALKIPQGSY